MPDGEGKHCVVAIDAAAGPLVLELQLPIEATISDALLRVRERIQATEGIDWEDGATGIWGQRRERSAVPRDGERIELYRALSADPRAQRRARALRPRVPVR